MLMGRDPAPALAQNLHPAVEVRDTDRLYIHGSKAKAVLKAFKAPSMSSGCDATPSHAHTLQQQTARLVSH